MAGPEEDDDVDKDPRIADPTIIDGDLLDSPLEYPDVRSHLSRPLDVTAYVQAHRYYRIPRRSRTPPLRMHHEPGPTHVLKATLGSPTGTVFHAGQTATIQAHVFYEKASPTSPIGYSTIPYYGDVIVQFMGKDLKGSGPHNIILDSIGTKVIKIRGVPEVGKQAGRTVELLSIPITVVCGASLPSDDDGLLSCIVFAEGGSNPRADAKELYAVAWSIRNRKELVKAMQEAYSADASSENKRKKNLVETVFGKVATYQAVITAPKQYSGYGSDEYKKCEDPAARVTTAKECERLKLSIKVATEVIAGSASDPYQGRGNPKARGVFFYMTKDVHAERKKRGGWVPNWEQLPALNGAKDIHFYWGMEPTHGFAP